MTRRRFRRHGRVFSETAREVLTVVVVIAVAAAAAVLNGAHPDGPHPSSVDALMQQGPAGRAIGPEESFR